MKPGEKYTLKDEQCKRNNMIYIIEALFYYQLHHHITDRIHNSNQEWNP